jgi:hypothetical protein
LVRPDGGGIQNGAGFVDHDGQLLEEPFPDPNLGPALEPVVHGLPGPESFGQVPPGDTGSGSPDDGVDEVTVPSLGDRTRSDGKESLNALPLSIAQFVLVYDEC